MEKHSSQCIIFCGYNTFGTSTISISKPLWLHLYNNICLSVSVTFLSCYTCSRPLVHKQWYGYYGVWEERECGVDGKRFRLMRNSIFNVKCNDTAPALCKANTDLNYTGINRKLNVSWWLTNQSQTFNCIDICATTFNHRASFSSGDYLNHHLD